MNKYLPYIIGLLLVAAIVTLFITGNNPRKKDRQLDERITLRRQDKIPYGTFVAYRNLGYLFPQADISVDNNEPGLWDSLSNYESKQALIVVAGRFSADEQEMKKMLSFIRNGNDVFVSARYISAAADEYLGCNSSSFDYYDHSVDEMEKNTSLSLAATLFGKKSIYSYPGRSFNSYFSSIDTATTEVLGYDKYGRINFIHLRAGEGNLYVHMEPLAFSNYFILHGNNTGYYEKALSLISPEVTKVVWDEYYLHKKDYNEPPRKKKSWFSVLMGMKNEDGKKPFAAAFWLLIGLLVLYVLMEMRRRQRAIPVVTRPRNDSLDFVKTIGRLYYDKGDHKNLCRKMSAYFLEHVRNSYKLATGTLDDAFVQNLQYKSGAGETTIREIVSFIQHLDDADAISPVQLKHFYKQLETFYSTT